MVKRQITQKSDYARARSHERAAFNLFPIT